MKLNLFCQFDKKDLLNKISVKIEVIFFRVYIDTGYKNYMRREK